MQVQKEANCIVSNCMKLICNIFVNIHFYFILDIIVHKMVLRLYILSIFSILSTLVIVVCAINESHTDFYALLELDKSATTKEIRKAFKKVALRMHPDKNQDDPEADSKFIRINRAYEVLKDEELRKKYDQFGEEGLEDRPSDRGYQSWTYYRDNFGIYDDDTEIITLSKIDFEESVLNSNAFWFINFYHPMCSHCHAFAPDWRWLSIELKGVVRIGAVNCDDEFHLCRNQNIRSYPSLMAYPWAERFNFEKTRDNLVSFILNRLSTGHGIPITAGLLYNMKLQLKRQKEENQESADFNIVSPASHQQPWLVAAFYSEVEFEDFKILLMKLAAMFKGVVSVGRVNCSSDAEVCQSLNISSNGIGPALRYCPTSLVLGGCAEIEGATAHAIAEAVLSLVPLLPLISNHDFESRLETLRKATTGAWLVQFSSEHDSPDPEYRKIAGLVAPIACHRVLCAGSVTSQCDALFIHKTPAFVLFKPGGGYELHHGRLLALDIANFAREAALSTNLRTLTPKEFPSVLSRGSLWFIEFYAPWCPPCMRLLPQFRKASVMAQEYFKSGSLIMFGIIDCTTHSDLCATYNVRSYPTMLLYNGSTPHQYSGGYSAQAIVEFIKDNLYSVVVALTPSLFTELVVQREARLMWVVDFFASWCGPCLAMAPEYRKFARLVSSHADVKVATIDCAQYREFCNSQNVRSYPTIRLYLAHSRPYDFSTYNEYHRDAHSFKRWLYSHLPSQVMLLNDRSFEEMLRSKQPWIVDFYAPWCGHCHRFAPEFEDISLNLKGSVRAGKIDCQAYSWVCRSAGVNAYPTVVFYRGATATSGQRSVRHTDGRQNPQGQILDSLDASEILDTVMKFVSRTASANRHDEL